MMTVERLAFFLHRYLSPFLAGVCAAGAAFAASASVTAALLLAALLFGFASLPAGGRMIRQIAGGAA